MNHQNKELMHTLLRSVVVGIEYVMLDCDKLHFVVHVILIIRLIWVGPMPHVGTAGNSD